MREIRTSGSMSGKWKRSMVELVRHRQPKAPETDRPNLNHRATSRLYPAVAPSCSHHGELAQLRVGHVAGDWHTWTDCRSTRQNAVAGLGVLQG